ncbi:MAG: phosphoribosylglycinamide formyltransferase [Flavobacteriales bacterium]|nr:phosphoribosylglycinamide formyltransferase [Flavobacteriales bacterium]
MKKRIAIFASGGGSNAARIIDHLKDSQLAEVVHVLSNRKSAGVHAIAESGGVPSMSFNRSALEEGGVTSFLTSQNIDLVVLAGFLMKIPDNLLRAFPDRIVNIHPALLPNYGGKGMYGVNVHEAVKAAGEKESGMTIHLVNENYDEGKLLFQAKIAINDDDDASAIAKKVLQLEHRFYPQIVEALCKA